MISRDDVERMATEAGVGYGNCLPELVRLAAIIEARVVESCAQVCESIQFTYTTIDDFAAAIRARAEHQRASGAGCNAQLAPGQWWNYCGETDMGQTAPVLCKACGGEYERAAAPAIAGSGDLPVATGSPEPESTLNSPREDYADRSDDP